MSTVAKPADKLSAEEKRALLAQLLQQKAGAPKSHPLSFAQQRLWILDQLDPGGTGYIMPTALRLVGRLDIPALERTLSEIARRHEVLRTTFPTLNGQPVQLIAPAQPLHLPIHDLTEPPEDERAAEARRRANEEAMRPFDLARGPLMRAQLLRLGEAEHILLLTMHHIISDGWSVGVLIREMGLLYNAFIAGRPSPLPDLPIQYADFAAWQRQRLQGPTLDAQLAYWKGILGDNPPVLALPTDRPRPLARTYRGDAIFFTLPPPLGDALKDLSQQAGATLFMTMLAAFKTLLHRYSGQTDIVVGTVIAGRNRAEIEDLIGFFLNTLVLRADLAGDPSYRALLAQVREVTLGAYANQDLPFEQLLEALQPARDLAHNPLFQVMLILQNAPFGSLDLPGLTLDLLELDRRNSEFDLTMFLSDSDQGPLGSLEYSTDLFDATTIRRMIGHFRTLLEGIVAQPERRLLDLPLLTAAERRQILAEWNDTFVELRSQEAEAGRPASGAALVHELIADQAAHTPDAVALTMTKDQGRTARVQSSGIRAQDDPRPGSHSRTLISEPWHLTYAALDRRANQLAHVLRARGIGPEDRVGICVARSPELVMGLLGILKAGAAYVPLDAAYPPERIRFMVEDSRARIIISDVRSTMYDLEDSDAQIVHLRDDWPAIAAERADPPDVCVRPDNLAYVIYTSGSTGTPKGVMVQHGSLASYTRVAGRDYALGPGDRTLQFASISWDTSAEEIYPTLAHGATLALRSESMIDSIERFLNVCQAQRLSVLNLPTAFWHELTIRLRADSLRAPGSLRVMIIGGERALGERIDAWRADVGPRVRLMNTYGATETTAVATLGDLSRGAPADLRETPIGRAIGNVQTYVLDARMRPVPIGVAGELHIGGSGVARGYLDRPDLTAARFVPNPFGQRSGVGGQGSEDEGRRAKDGGVDSSFVVRPSSSSYRLYKTGDLARCQPNGMIEYLGRIDQQIKLRGFRIELGEIEAALNQHPAVWESVVVVREDAAPGGRAERRLVAYVVPRIEDSGLKTENRAAKAALASSHYLRSFNLRDALKARLPEYMIPAAFVLLEALPLNPNGKVDRRALPAPDLSGAAQGKPFTAPRTRAEQALAQIWCDVLGLPYVGVHDHFFELGGHSLLATQVTARVRKDLKIELPLRSMFESPTIAELAQLIGEREQPASPHVNIPRSPRDRDSYPLSFAQQRLWFLDQLAPGNPFYNLFSSWRLSGVLSVGALARSAAEMVRRHESLRTRFVSEDGRPAQVIAPDLALPLPLLDLRVLDLEQREPIAHQLGHAEARRPFDLARGPLLRLTLLRLDEYEHVLLLTIHHIISDGWSTALIVRELGALYAAFAARRPSPLPDLPIQYVDFALWQREWLEGERLAAQLDYWKTQLAGIPTLDLPTDRPRPAVQSFRGSRHTFTIPARLTEALRALCLRARVTTFMALLAAFDALLARYTGQDDIVVGTPIANRRHSDVERLIGFFVNTLVLRGDLRGNPTTSELLGRIRQATLGAYAQQDLPFERLVEALQPERDISRTPLVQALFVLNNIPVDVQRIDELGLTIGGFDVDTETTNFDLTFNITEAPRDMHGWLTYNRDLFDPTTIARMVGHYRVLLEGMVAGPDRRIGDLPLLTAPERRQALAEWNDTDADIRSHKSEVRSQNPVSSVCLHELVAEQAARTPDAIAVAFDAEATKDEGSLGFGRHSSLPVQLSYGALERRASQLARYLRARGVGPDAIVGVSIERSVELVIALLGVLKAGGAYLPLDPGYPSERQRFMLEDSRATALIIYDLRLTIDDLEATIVNRQFKIVNLKDDWPAIAAQPADGSAPTLDPDNLAYVIYTSGSTGSPKGTLNSHRAIINRLRWMQRAYRLGPADRVLQKTPFSFDVSVWEFFWPLMTGSALVVARPGGHQDPAYLAALIGAQRITTLHFVPSMLQAFLEARGLAACRDLKRVICSGEALPSELVARFFERIDADLHNLYGPTEAAVDVTAWDCRTGDDRPTPIGRPIANTRIYLLDRELQPAQIGATGELYIGGIQLARGYLGRPGLTAERFIPNPFAEIEDRRLKIEDSEAEKAKRLSSIFYPRSSAGGRLYKTGDLARYRADGAIEFLGRIDGQVKLRGFRIELGEIASVLARHPSVRDAVVLARQDAPGDQRLVAYVVQGSGVRGQGSEDPASEILNPDPQPLIPALRAWLAARLPEYMVPSAFVALDALPTTPNGKLDRKALPPPDQDRAAPEDMFVAPRTPVEQDLARIWAELLGVARVGVNDNFFALGGHSLLMTQVVSRIWAAFDVEVPIQSFFQDPTVAGLAIKITEMRVAQHDADTVSRLLDQLDLLSEAELAALLDQPAASPDGPAPEIAAPAAPAAPVDAGQRYRSAAIERIPMGSRQTLIYSHHSRAAQVTPAEDADLLERCGSFKTLDQHARDLAGDRADEAEIAALRERLDQLAGASLLIGERATLDRIAERPSAAPAPRIAAVGFPTSDRIPALQRALVSYIEQRRRYERTHELVVIDDARRPEVRRAGREMLAALGARYGVAIRYAGLEEKVAYARRLVEAGDLPPDVVDFALFGEQLGLVTLGSNRNGLLLDTIGEVILSADDDTTCRLTAAPARNDRLALASGHPPRDIFVYPDRAAQLRAAPFVETDALAQHERLLGQDPRDCIAAFRAGSGVDLSHADAGLLQRLEASAGRVAVTLNGIRGDCGWGSPAGYMFLEGESFERITRSEATYRAACLSREILNVVQQPVICDRADDLMTTFFGLDNRVLTPPFLTVGRGSDAIFGMMLARCFDDRYFAHLPWAMQHTPADPRAFWPGEIVRGASGIGIALLVTILIHSFEPGSGGARAGDGLRGLGAHIEQLARLPEADFEEFLRLRIWRGASMQIGDLEARLSAPNAPPYWAGDVTAYLNLLHQSLHNRELALPLELLPGRSLDEARALRLRLTRAFGQLFDWWPAITETARTLRAQGERLSRPL